MRLSAYNSTASTTYTLTEVQPNKPYLAVSNSYLPLTTNTSQGVRMKIQSGTNSYRPMVYTSGSLESDYYTTSTDPGYMSSVSTLTRESVSTTTYGTQVTKTGEEYRTQVTKTSESYQTATSSSSKESYTYTTAKSTYTVPEWVTSRSDYVTPQWVTSRSDYTVAQTVTRESDYTVPQTVTSRSDYQTVITVTSKSDYKTTATTAVRNVVSHTQLLLQETNTINSIAFPEYSGSERMTYYNETTILQFKQWPEYWTNCGTIAADLNNIKYGYDSTIEVTMRYTTSLVLLRQRGDIDCYANGEHRCWSYTQYVDTQSYVNTEQQVLTMSYDTDAWNSGRYYESWQSDYNQVAAQVHLQCNSTTSTTYATDLITVSNPYQASTWTGGMVYTFDNTRSKTYGTFLKYPLGFTYREYNSNYGETAIVPVNLTATQMSSSAYDVTHTEMSSSAYNTTVAVNTSSAYDVTVPVNTSSAYNTTIPVNTSSAYNTTIPVNTSSAYDTTITASGSSQYTVTTKTVDLTAVTTTSTVDLTAVTTTHTGYETRSSTSGYSGVSSSSYSKTTWL